MESRGFPEEQSSPRENWPGQANEPERASDARESGGQEAQQEQAAVEERKAISVRVVYHAILAEGESELERPTSALFFSGLAAGLSMGFSFLTQGFLQANLPKTSWAELIAKLGYSLGF